MMVKDEVCSTYLPQEDAIKEKIDGGMHYFCSKNCRDKFLEERKREPNG
jgi:YHS domain-containing protein